MFLNSIIFWGYLVFGLFLGINLVWFWVDLMYEGGGVYMGVGWVEVGSRLGGGWVKVGSRLGGMWRYGGDTVKIGSV